MSAYLLRRQDERDGLLQAFWWNSAHTRRKYVSFEVWAQKPKLSRAQRAEAELMKTEAA